MPVVPLLVSRSNARLYGVIVFRSSLIVGVERVVLRKLLQDCQVVKITVVDIGQRHGLSRQSGRHGGRIVGSTRDLYTPEPASGRSGPLINLGMEGEGEQSSKSPTHVESESYYDSLRTGCQSHKFRTAIERTQVATGSSSTIGTCAEMSRKSCPCWRSAGLMAFGPAEGGKKQLSL